MSTGGTITPDREIEECSQDLAGRLLALERRYPWCARHLGDWIVRYIPRQEDETSSMWLLGLI